MTATTLNPTTTTRRSIAGVVAGTIVLLAALAVVIVLTVSRITGGSSGTISGGSGYDNSDCHPTSVVHYC
jgi:hypothetical protein